MTLLDDSPPPTIDSDVPLRWSDAAQLRTGPDGKTFAYNELTGRVVALHGPAEPLIALLDGSRSLDDLWQMAGGSPTPDLDDPRRDRLAGFVDGLGAAGLVVAADHDVADAATGVQVTTERVRDMPPGWKLRIHLPASPDELGRTQATGSVSGMRKWAIRAIGLLGAVGHLFVFMSLGLALGELGEPPARTAGIVAITMATIIVQLAFHEAAHGLALRAFGLSVREVGVRFWFFLLPSPYVAQGAEVFLPRKRQRVIVALAGIASDGITGLLAWFAFSTFASDGVLLGWAMVHVGLLMLNLNPFLPTDGARTVEALCGEVALRTRSIRWARARLTGAPMPPGAPTTRGKQAYGIASILLIAVFGLVVAAEIIQLILRIV